MQTIINHYIIDNDPKGSNGRGTVFGMTITVKIGETEEVHEFEYSMLDCARKIFNPEAVRKPFIDRQRAYEKALEDEDRVRKQAAKETRAANVTIDSRLEGIIKDVVEAEAKAMLEYQNGNAKALNAVVGKVMAAAKSKSMAVDAFSIMTYLKSNRA